MAFDLTSTAFDSLRDEPTFEEWMELVDQAFIDVTGLDRDSWPDSDYYNHWEEGCSPMEAVATLLYEEYGDEGLEAFDLEDVI